MHQTFGQQITSTAYQRLCYAEAPGPPEFGAPGTFNGSREQTKKARNPVNWTVIVGAAAYGNSSYSGVRVRVTAILGNGQVREFTLGTLARRWNGRAVALSVEAQLLSTGETVEVSGAYGYNETDVESPAVFSVSNLIASHTLSYAQATSDSAITGIALLGTAQEEARRFSLTSGPLTTGSAMVPVTVTLYGQRVFGGIWVPLGSMVVDQGVGGGNSIPVEVLAGQYNGLGYQVTGFPAANGGSATMVCWEELDVEGC